jgi:hypothetical protein
MIACSTLTVVATIRKGYSNFTGRPSFLADLPDFMHFRCRRKRLRTAINLQVTTRH